MSEQKIISIHSFRGGTGKSNTTANLATLIAQAGYSVGVIDTDIQSPGIHVLFGLEEDDMRYSLNDYLWNNCEIYQAAYDVTANVGVPVEGQIFLIPSSIKTGEIARVLREGYDVGLLNDGFQDLLEHLDLDVLLVDTHPGLNEETLLSIAISDALIIIMRPDNQDYQGTGVTVEVARKLDVPNLFLAINKVPQSIDFDNLIANVEQVYDADVGVLIPHSDELMVLASEGVFAARYPDNPISQDLRNFAERLMALD